MSKFGILAKLNFLQDWVSAVIAGVNPAILHNVEKYYFIKKTFYLSAMEDIEGDYLEFGVFTGSSFCHAIRCCKKLSYLNSNVARTRFFGFDSFAGFGELKAEDKHPFYTDENFTTSLPAVKARADGAARGKVQVRLVPGFFSDSLKGGPGQLGVTLARIIFIDSDTYNSALEALEFCAPTVQEGTFIILDDYFSYRGSSERGVAKAFREFSAKNGIESRQVFHYGMGGEILVVSKINRKPV